MSVRLDWQIEAEPVHQRTGEDPSERRRRRRQRLRVVLLTLFVAGWVVVIGALVAYRLFTVENKLRQDLIDVVQAETTTLRIGDYAGYMAIQRSSSDSWIRVQSDRFARYQELKTAADLRLTGSVVSVTIDGLRGRVILEEVLDGVPYHTVWFYWRYADGWRHVPSDYTFWGDSRTITGEVSSVTYRELDARLARALAPRLDQWWAEGCMDLDCGLLPNLAVQIVSSPSMQAHWDETDPTRLRVPSPLASQERARADVAIPPQLENAIAMLIAERLFDTVSGGISPLSVADAAWLRQSMIEWLAASFTGHQDADRLGFIQSIRDNYGLSALQNLARVLAADSDISILSVVLGQPIEHLSLDWRAFFQWRLDVEKTLLARGDQASVAALWDATNPAAQALLQQRLANPLQPTGQVQAVAVAPGPDGSPRASVQVTIEGNPTVIAFRLVDGSWKRTA